MKIYAEFDNGEKQELKELTGLQPDCEVVFIRMPQIMAPVHVKQVEGELSEKIGKKVVVLDCRFGEVFVM